MGLAETKKSGEEGGSRTSVGWGTNFCWIELTPLDMFIILSLVIALLLIDDVNHYMYVFLTVSRFF